MFEAGSLQDRVARAIYAEAPAADRSGNPIGFDLALLLQSDEVARACLQANAAAQVLHDYQEAWVHLMSGQLGNLHPTEPGLFPDRYKPRRASTEWSTAG